MNVKESDVQIYKMPGVPTQSARFKKGNVILAFCHSSKPVYSNIAHWVSCTDTSEQIKLKFDNYSDAIHFAKRNELSYDLLESSLSEPTKNPKSYADNFKSRVIF